MADRGAWSGGRTPRPHLVQENALYKRWRLRGGVSGQMLLLRGDQVRMVPYVHGEVLKLDFRSTVIRSDLPGPYRARPGFLLHRELETLRKAGASAVLLNGNNVGYWGNQFVIQERELVYKPKGPIFDDDRLHHHVAGKHAFFHAGDRFRVSEFNLAAAKKPDQSEVEISAPKNLPECGLSGFPLVRWGEPRWKDHYRSAWDPALLFDVGPFAGAKFEVLAGQMRKRIETRPQLGLARHPMTVVGVRDDGDILLLVVERQDRPHRPGGITVDEAATLMISFHAEDAIVLGAAGDAQLATTREGVLTRPYVAPYAKAAAEKIPEHLLCREEVGDGEVLARPIPCYLLFQHRVAPLPAPVEPTAPVAERRSWWRGDIKSIPARVARRLVPS